MVNENDSVGVPEDRGEKSTVVANYYHKEDDGSITFYLEENPKKVRKGLSEPTRTVASIPRKDQGRTPLKIRDGIPMEITTTGTPVLRQT